MMEIRLTRHAELQLQERNLSGAQVVAIATQPEQIIEEAGVPLIAQSRVMIDSQLYLIRVAFRDENNIRIVIAAYRTSKLEKYWAGD